MSAHRDELVEALVALLVETGALEQVGSWMMVRGNGAEQRVYLNHNAGADSDRPVWRIPPAEKVCESCGGVRRVVDKPHPDARATIAPCPTCVPR